jgi:hypothetical protein
MRSRCVSRKEYRGERSGDRTVSQSRFFEDVSIVTKTIPNRIARAYPAYVSASKFE